MPQVQTAHPQAQPRLYLVKVHDLDGASNRMAILHPAILPKQAVSPGPASHLRLRVLCFPVLLQTRETLSSVVKVLRVQPQ